jgi:hypothetical protein
MWPFRSRQTLRELDLVQEGVAVYRAAVAPNDVATIKSAADRAYELVEAARDVIEPGGPHADLIKHIAQSTIQWGGIPISHALDIAAADCPAAPEAFARTVTRAEEIVASLREQRGAVYRSELSYFRRHRGTATHVPWHFDAGAAGTEAYDPCFNVWLPLVAVGTDCPALQFLPRTGARMRAGEFTGTVSGYPDAAWIADNMSGRDRLAPALQPSDIAIFDHWTLHRTQPFSGDAKMRTSAEIRLSSLPD